MPVQAGKFYLQQNFIGSSYLQQNFVKLNNIGQTGKQTKFFRVVALSLHHYTTYSTYSTAFVTACNLTNCLCCYYYAITPPHTSRLVDQYMHIGSSNKAVAACCIWVCHSHRPIIVPMLSSVHCQKLHWKCEHQNWTINEGGLV